MKHTSDLGIERAIKMDYTKPLPSRKPLLGLMCLRRCSSTLCRLNNEGALIVRMAPLLCVFSSSPSVSTRPKNLTGCAWVQIAVDIIVEIFQDLPSSVPQLSPSSSSFPVSSLLFVLHIEMHFSQEVRLEYLYLSSWILHHLCPWPWMWFMSGASRHY